MINYLKSEIYRMSQIKSTYLFPIGLTLFFLGMLGLVILTPVEGRDSSELLFFSVSNLLFVFPLQIPLMAQTVFADEHGNGTFKNSISYGVDRKTLFIGKLILTLLYPALVFLIAMSIFLISTNLLMDVNPVEQQIFLTSIMKSLPALLALFFFANMLSFVIKKISLQWGAYFAVALGLPTMLVWIQSVTGWRVLGALFNFTPIGLLMQINIAVLTGQMAKWSDLWLVLVVYAVVSIAIGLVSFSKQDV